MNINHIDEIINKNSKMLENINEYDNICMQIRGILKNIESIIPEDSRENFYTNLSTLNIICTESINSNPDAVGGYNEKENHIYVNKNMLENTKISEHSVDMVLRTMYHELLHMASTTRDEEKKYYSSGFENKFMNKDGEFMYSESLVGMSEGITEKLAIDAFNKKSYESFSVYLKQMNFIEHMSLLVGMETIKKAYFNNRNGMSQIEEKLKEIDGQDTHRMLYQKIETEFNSSLDPNYDPVYQGEYDENLVYSIEKDLLGLSKIKINKLIESDSKITNEEIFEFWRKTAGTMNFKEKLEMVGEDTKKYKSIEKLRDDFLVARDESLNKKMQFNSKIYTEDINKENKIYQNDKKSFIDLIREDNSVLRDTVYMNEVKEFTKEELELLGVKEVEI